MIKLQDILQDTLKELATNLNSALPFTLEKEDDDFARYIFKTPNNIYEVYFSQEEDMYESSKVFERQYEPIDEHTFKQTNEHMAVAVNATVMKITLDFLKRHPDFDMVFATPIESRRFNLVKRFMESTLPNKYTLKVDGFDLQIYNVPKGQPIPKLK
jgi:hypothetical protein